MRVTTERLEDCQVKVIVELDDAEAEQKLRQTARKISRQFNIPGYRRGKAPLAAVIRTFGREAIQEQAIEDFGQDLYEQALSEIEVKPYLTGGLEEVGWEPFRMTILLPIPPELDLGDYRSVRVPYEPKPVTDEQIDEFLAELQQQHAQWVPVERPASLGDQVVVDMEGKVDDELVMSNEGYEVVLEAASPNPLPGFHEAIVGMSPGEAKSFILAIPEDDADDAAAGQEAAVTARLHSVKEREIPPLDDDLAMMIGTYDTLEDLRASVQEELQQESSQQLEAEYLDSALAALVEAAVKLEYPPQAVDREAEQALSEMERNLALSGIQLDRYLAAIGKTREMYKQDLLPAAEERLKKRLVLYEIAKLEGLDIDSQTVDAEIERMGERLGAEADEVMQTLQSPEGRLMMADDLLLARARERAIQIARGEAPPLEEEGKSSEPHTESLAEETQAQAGLEEEGGTEAEPEARPELESELQADGEETQPEPLVQEATPDSTGEPGGKTSG